MNYHIESKELDVVVSTIGGELQSIKDKIGTEYLWQANPKFWEDRAPNLFPYIARLTKNQYILNNKLYQMDIHGFVKNMELDNVVKKSNKLTFQLCDNEITRSQYPYRFTYKIMYELKENKLEIMYVVKNNDTKEMYFGVGGHPGFPVPLHKKLEFEDYYLEFEKPCKPQKIGFTKDCFLNGENRLYSLMEDKKIGLKHSLFDQDAIILENTSKAVTLRSDKDKKSITVEYPDMPYIGFWHVPKKKAPYVCIEPWTSLPSRKDVIEDISLQSSLVSLKPQHTYKNKWSIRIN